MSQPAEPGLVTFVVMAWRQEAMVRAAIEGAFAQTHPRMEILLSDDASPDGTFAVMEEMAAAYAGPHAVRLNRNPENLGLLGHIHRVFDLARGELIVYNAGDDVSVPDRAARLHQAWQAAGRPALVHSNVTDLDAGGHPLPRQRDRDRHAQLEAKSLEELAVAKNTGIGATAAWSPELIRRFGPITETGLFEDRVFYFRARLLGPVAYVDDRLVGYRRGAGLSFDRGEGEAETRKNFEIDLATLRQRRADLLAVAPDQKAALRAIDRKIAKRQGQLAELDGAAPDPDRAARKARRAERRAGG